MIHLGDAMIAKINWPVPREKIPDLDLTRVQNDSRRITAKARAGTTREQHKTKGSLPERKPVNEKENSEKTEKPHNTPQGNIVVEWYPAGK